MNNSSMKKIFKRIGSCVNLDRANNSEFFIYIVEELGEAARAYNEEIGNKTVKSTETTGQELCDVLVTTFGLLHRLGWSYEEIKAYTSSKVSKYENSVGLTGEKV